MTVYVDERAVEYQEVEGRYSTIRVAELTGATYRQVDYWLRSEDLIPDESAKSRGSGNYRSMSFEQLEQCFYAVGLTRVGFTTPAALRLARTLVYSGTVDVTVADIVRVRVDVRTEGGA